MRIQGNRIIKDTKVRSLLLMLEGKKNAHVYIAYIFLYVYTKGYIIRTELNKYLCAFTQRNKSRKKKALSKREI